MSFIDLHFSYNGVKSKDMGVYLVRMSTGFIDSPMFGDRSLSFDLIQDNPTPYYYGQTVSPFRVKLQIAPTDGRWSRALQDRVTRWLNNGKFNEFYSTDDIDRIYYLSYVGSPMLYRTANQEGYLELEFHNIDCFVRSMSYSEIFDLSEGVMPGVIELTNLGDYPLSPQVQIRKAGAGSVSIVNMSNAGQSFAFANLSDGETLRIDCANRNIASDSGAYRYDDFSGSYLTLPYGINRLEVTGKCHLQFSYRYLYSSQ